MDSGENPKAGDAQRQSELSEALMSTFIMGKQITPQWTNFIPKTHALYFTFLVAIFISLLIHSKKKCDLL